MKLLERISGASRCVIVVLIASVMLLTISAVGVHVGWWSTTSEVVERPDCRGWNTEHYFEDATGSDVLNCLHEGADPHARTEKGVTPLLWVARDGIDPAVVGVLVRAGVNANEMVEVEGMLITPLVVAADRHDGADMTKALLMEGATANLAVHEGVTPLHAAARGARVEALTLLLEHGADPGVLDADGRTPLGMAVAGNRFGGEWDHKGRIANVIWVIRALLVNGSAVTDLTRHGWTDLHTAALLGTDPQEVATLVDDGFDPNAKTSSGWTVLHLAAFANESSAIVELLLDKGADVHARFGDGRTPLHCAAFGNPNPLVATTLLRAGSEPDGKTMTGWTPLHAAAYSNANPEVLAALLSGGADANVGINETWTWEDLFPNSTSRRVVEDLDTLIMLDGLLRSGFTGHATALHFAVSFRRGPAVVAALILGGADPNARDSKGETPLHEARSSADVVALIDAGADPNARSKDGGTPLHAAAILRDIEVVSAMIRGGANASAVSESGWTPLHSAALRSADEDAVDVVSLLIRSGGDPNGQDAQGRTPLHVASNSRKTGLTLIDALVDGGSNPNARDKKGETPLFKAIGAESNQAVVSRLIDAGADPNLRDAGGATALHRALVWRSDASVVDALLDGGADAGLADDDGSTPWEIAQNHESLKGTKTYWRLNDARFE